MRIILAISLLILSVASNAQTKVAAPLVRNSNADNTYGTHYDSLGYGGYAVFSSITTRNLYPISLRKVGMMAAVDTSLYQLTGGTSNANWRPYYGGGSTASNGITKVGNDTRLGGNLTQSTYINGKNIHALFFDSLQGMEIRTASGASILDEEDAMYIVHPEELSIGNISNIRLKPTQILSRIGFTQSSITRDSISTIVEDDGNSFIKTVQISDKFRINSFLEGANSSSEFSSEGLNLNGKIGLNGNYGTSGQFLKSRGSDSTPVWNTIPICEIYTASNGLNKVGSDFRLGGSLISNTAINGNFNFDFDNIKRFKTVAADSVVISAPLLRYRVSSIDAAYTEETTLDRKITTIVNNNKSNIMYKDADLFSVYAIDSEVGTYSSITNDFYNFTHSSGNDNGGVSTTLQHNLEGLFLNNTRIALDGNFGTSGQVLTSMGSANPVWTTMSGGGGGGGLNFYNSDSSLSGNRIVNGNRKNLNFGTGIDSMGNVNILSINTNNGFNINDRFGGTIATTGKDWGLTGLGAVQLSGVDSLSFNSNKIRFNNKIFMPAVRTPWDTLATLNDVRSVGGGNGWGLNGNTGTNAGSNFIGTTDNTDLVFKRDGLQVGRLSFTYEAIGSDALANNTADYNTGIGFNSLKQNVNGENNVSIGAYSLTNNINGSNSTAIGASSLNNANTDNNTAIGNYSLFNTTGSNNIGIGSYSGRYLSLGSRFFVNSINRLSATGDSTLSILYGVQSATIANQKLRVNGSLQINNGTQGVGKVFTSDANGVGSWQTTSGGSSTWGGITGTLSSQTDLQTALNNKQNNLISGTNIKTINGSSLLGSGDITISGGGGLETFNEPSTGFTGVTFTCTNSPTAGTLRLFKNGIRLVLGYDYTIAGSTVTLSISAISSDFFIKDYKY